MKTYQNEQNKSMFFSKLLPEYNTQFISVTISSSLKTVY